MHCGISLDQTDEKYNTKSVQLESTLHVGLTVTLGGTAGFQDHGDIEALVDGEQVLSSELIPAIQTGSVLRARLHKRPSLVSEFDLTGFAQAYEWYRENCGT